MIRRLILICLISFNSLLGLFSQSKTEVYNIIPRPNSMETTSGTYNVGCNSSIYLDNKLSYISSNLLADILKSEEGTIPKITILDSLKDSKGDIRFRYIKSLPQEAYSITSSSRGLDIYASSSRGFFYAVETLRQIIAQSESKTNNKETIYTINNFKISDSPRFVYRGLMLDVARFFMPKQDLKKLIDAMALLKLNKLHLHLTDDNGWRIEIKRYPKLTSVGAYRVDREKEFFSHRRNQKEGEKATIGGYYTQDDLRDIVSYASQRMIDIIPEIDIPAHSNAALSAYPEYACSVVDKKVTVLPGIGEDHHSIIFCAGKDKTFTFLENILDEVMSIFPYKYIHIGGDEADKTYWKKCPDCQKRIKNNNLKDEEALQGYFMQRISNYLKSKGRSVIGWDEVTNFDIPKDMVVFGWRGNGNAALKAAKLGHKFVLTPAKKLYLIRYQGPQWFEPMTYFGNNTLKDIYEYEPIKASWSKDEANLLEGLQASMWTEFCRSSYDVFYMIFPRLLALSDISWSKSDKDYPRFLKAVDKFLPMTYPIGINYAKSMYNIQHKVMPNDNYVLVELSSGRPDMDIRYTLDGSIPTSNSPLYTEKIKITGNTIINTALFNANKQVGKTLNLPISFNIATGKKFLSDNNKLYPLTNGVRGSIRQSDFEWVTFAPDKPSSFTLDLGNNKQIREIALGVLNNYAMAVHRPQKIIFEVSSDNINYRVVGDKVFDRDSTFIDANFVSQEGVSFSNMNVRYIRITTIPWGKVPDNHVRVGRMSMYYYDELIVR